MVRPVVVAVPGVLVPVLGVVQGGFHPDAWVWAGTLAAWAAALGLVVGGDAAGVAAAWRWLVFGLGLVCWTLVSVLWSVEPAQSLLEARRTVVYVAVVLALVVLARRGAPAVLAGGTHAGITGLVLYALGRYLLGPRRHDVFEGYLLSQPLGYANAVGVLAAMGLVLAVALSAGTRRVSVRALLAGSVPLLALALELSSSDASWLALAVGVVGVVLLEPNLGSLLRLLAAVIVPAAVAVWVGRYSGLVEDAVPQLAGPTVALVTGACAAAAAATAVTVRPRSGGERGMGRRGLALVAVVGVLVVGAIAVVHAGATQPRSAYYHVAWAEYRAHPLLGSGGGTFGRYWVLSGLPARWGGALDAHSLYLETLAELGPVGLLLLLAFLLYPLRRVVACRRQPGVVAAAGAAAVFLVHAGLDWDWELPAVVVAGLACTVGVMLAQPGRGTAQPQPARLPLPARAVVLATALMLGAAALAGVRSTTEPSAGIRTSRAPSPGALLAGSVVYVGSG